ncbi:uncharacterized protein RCC_06827 [Ramularia collo-cygni]|uniref:Uncharacterized protein n=1 Tax=Ramularia collo-cygni TaxID=112498 RepID=A0A2D3VBA4_9PEZI|nr:uncharacterized protein RCC_06827 [Ramularia collo-cygni]CZT20966.1 uncharacterized protein RCC_06827 [Ramularia collo-cygni]
MSEEPRKRSRFDQTAPAPAEKKGRFDRRSQSPQRSPAPVKSIESSTEADDKKPDPAAAAAAAAARINAQIARQKGAQHVDVPPIRATSAGAAKSPSASTPAAPLNAEVYQQDGDFIKDIEVNDLRNRYTLTKGSTQKMVNIHFCTMPTDTPRGSLLCHHHHHLSRLSFHRQARFA